MMNKFSELFNGEYVTGAKLGAPDPKRQTAVDPRSAFNSARKALVTGHQVRKLQGITKQLLRCPLV